MPKNLKCKLVEGSALWDTLFNALTVRPINIFVNKFYIYLECANVLYKPKIGIQ